MTRKRILCAVAGGALTAVMTISVATPASAACRAPVRGAQLSGINQTITEFRARGSWRNKVRTIHGYRFARWSYARNKNMDCDKPRPGRTWSCRAIASPCDRPPRSP
jgi:hypothetical protein